MAKKNLKVKIENELLFFCSLYECKEQKNRSWFIRDIKRQLSVESWQALKFFPQNVAWFISVVKIIEVNAAWSFIKFMHTESPLSFTLYLMTTAIWGVTLGHFGKFILFFFLQSQNSTEKRKCCFLVHVCMVNKVEALKYWCFWKDQSFLSHINVSLLPSHMQYSSLVQMSELPESCRCIF